MHAKNTPIKEHIKQWDNIIEDDCYKYTITELSKNIQEKGSLDNFTTYINGNENDVLEFLNSYYILLNEESDHIRHIIADEFVVIPNQLGEFKRKSDLYIDKDVEEEIKNACLLISEDPRNYLIHKNVHTGEGMLYHYKHQIDVVNEINNIIKNDSDNANISKCCDYLASIFPDSNLSERREKIYSFSQQVYPDDFTQRRVLTNFDEKIWEESDKKSIFYIVSDIAGYKTAEEAASQLCFENSGAFILWLDNLVSFLVKEGFENNINRIKYPILPNQNGIFCVKDDLFLDSGDIDNELKDISCELGHDFRDELLNSTICLTLSENRTHTIINVAENISAAIKPIIRDVDKRKDYKDTLKKFYLWMDHNKSKAKQHFEDLYEKKFLFLDDDDISQNIKKATEFDKLMVEYGISSIDDLRARLSKIETPTHNSSNEYIEKITVTQDVLVSFAISSQQELDKIMQDPEITQLCSISTPTPEMFIYVQELIKRAKENIINHLKNLSDYDCTDLEEVAPTILAGILKNGMSIQVVTRPSDNGEVRIYYSSEKDALDCDNAELWVENNQSAPHMLTLGRILKSTGITRIPIKMNE